MNNKNKYDIEAENDSELVDEAGRESFPASDPPAWTTGSDKQKKNEDESEEESKPQSKINYH